METKRIPWEKAQFFLTEGGGLPQDSPPPEAALRLLRLAVQAFAKVQKAPGPRPVL